MIFWALSLCDQTWSVHSRITECGPFHVGISWLCKLGTGRESWSLPPQWAMVMKQKQQKVSQRLLPREFEVRPAVSPCKVLTSQERGWVQGWGGRYPGLHKMPDSSSHGSRCLGLWVSICNFSKRQWFQKCVAPFPLKWGSFTWRTPGGKGADFRKSTSAECYKGWSETLWYLLAFAGKHLCCWHPGSALDLSAISLPV